MGNKKYIVAAAILAMLCIGFNASNADFPSNSLTQMDVKKSSATDTVDVTFYTTDANANTVVTRKGNNRYVVLLPNVSSNPSVTPNIGGLKDLISDISVKHINDGIGGYTKVTFETTKPINIKTYNKKSSPLTQAQKDAKNIIAQNATKPAVNTTTQPKPSAEKPVSNTTTKPAATTTKTTETKPAAKTSTPTSSATPKLIPVEVPKIKQNTAATKPHPKVEPTKTVAQPKVTEQPKKVQPKAKTIKNDFIDSSYNPKMKFDGNGKRTVDLEPRISHTTDNVQQKTTDNTISETTTPVVAEDTTPPITSELPNETNNNKSSFPLWTLLIGGTIVGLGIIYLVIDAIVNANKKQASRYESFHTISERNQEKRRRKEYYDIVNNDELNWQEKYKLYTEKEKQYAPKQDNQDASYITDIGATQKAILMPEETTAKEPVREFNRPAPTVRKSEKTHNDIVREKLQAKISQMEHSLNQTPISNVPTEQPKGVQSEDNSILHSFADIKLKSFSKPVNLKETNRTLIDDEQTIPYNGGYKEGQFVKLKNSALSVNRRKSAASELNSSDLINTGNKYLTNNNGDKKMNKENENYLLSSLDEYLSILDSEENKKQPNVKDTLSRLRPAADVMNRSGVSNPISRTEKTSLSPLHGGLIVKSGYNIDANKGIYLVNVDGVSAIVGRIKDNVTILKKFDKVVDKQLQVRAEDDHVYIVRVGNYKCLIDVTENRIGTLIEI